MKKTELLPLGIFLIFLGCASAPSTVAPVAEEPERELSCFAVMNTVPGTPIESVGEGTLRLDYGNLPDDFTLPLIYSVEHEYYYEGKTLTSRFELIYDGIADPSVAVQVSRKDRIGIAAGEKVTLCARSGVIDPYLVSTSYHPPEKRGDFWYYFPGMYLPSEMKWLSYQPAEYDRFKSMYEHATTGEEGLGMTLFNWWILHKTSLDAYPEEGVQTVYFGDLPLKLEYQEGFTQYLLDEYTLGDTIYLYLQIRGINGFGKEFLCYVRDFSLKPPEDIVRERIEAIEK